MELKLDELWMEAVELPVANSSRLVRPFQN